MITFTSIFLPIIIGVAAIVFSIGANRAIYEIKGEIHE